MADGPLSEAGAVYSLGPFLLHTNERLLAKDGVRIAIGSRALDVLIALTERAGVIVSVRELIARAWPDTVVEEANLRIQIAALRRLFGGSDDASRYVVNVPGRGYLLVAPVHRVDADTGSPIDDNSAAVRQNGLPPPPSSMIGRTETVAELVADLSSERLISLVGPGGIGKTTVAVAVAHAASSTFAKEAVFFVDLSQVLNKSDVASAIAAAIGCYVPGPNPEPFILGYLANRRVLIVLDSCEHLIETVAPFVARLLRACSFAHVLTTGREALRVDGEKIFLLSPLSLPEHDKPSAAEALSTAAVQLFMARALSSGHTAELRDADAPVVVDICRRLGGIALAIELVASRVGYYGIRGTADLLEHDAALRLQGSEETSARHRTLQTMLDWSFNLLSDGEQHLLCTLSIFVGPFTHEALQAVADDGTNLHVLPSAITSLVDKSLVAVITSGPLQYRLLDTTRDYAAEKLEASGHMAPTAERHASYFASLLRSGIKDGSDFDGREAAKYSGHIGNIRKALQWSFADRSRHAIGLDLASHAVPIFRGLSQFTECQYWCRQAIACLTVGDRETPLEFQLFYALARSAVYAPGELADVIEVFDHALRLAGRLTLTRSELNLLADLNVILTRRGDFTRALHTAETSASVADRSGGSTEKVLSEWLLGASYHASGDQAAALRHCKLGFRLAAYAPPVQLDILSEARARFALARSLWLRGFPDQAIQAAHQTIEQMAKYDHHVAYCFALVYAIPVFLWAGDLKAAAFHIQTAIDHAERYSLGTFQAIARSQKGELLIATGEQAAGIEAVQEAHREMLIGPYHIAASYTACVLAKELAVSGEGDRAQKVLDAAMLRADRVEEQCWRPLLLLTRGEVSAMNLDVDLSAAEIHLQRAIQCALEQSALSWELKATTSLARLLRQNGKKEEARSRIERIYRRFTEGFATSDLIAARRLIGELDGGSPLGEMAS